MRVVVLALFVHRHPASTHKTNSNNNKHNSMRRLRVYTVPSRDCWAALPPQLSFELHTQGAANAGLGARFGAVAALVDAGYVLVSRDDNLVVPGCCTELTFIHGCKGVVH